MKNFGLKKWVRSVVCAALGGVAIAALSFSPPASASVRIEAVGAVPLAENAGTRELEAARGEAFQRAIWEAVRRGCDSVSPARRPRTPRRSDRP